MEILFRGFHADENGTQIVVVKGVEYKGEWLEGDFCRPSNIVFETIGYDEVLKQDNVPIWNDYNVLPETIGQYTGLNDKNGKKIFEGDIMQLCSATYPCTVYWDGIGWAWKTNSKRRDIDLTREKMEVIGNAFDKEEENG